MQKTDYNKVFEFDINRYLIDWYPSMNMKTRAAICHLALTRWLYEDVHYEVVDNCIAEYAMSELNILKKEEKEEDSID